MTKVQGDQRRKAPRLFFNGARPGSQPPQSSQGLQLPVRAMSESLDIFFFYFSVLGSAFKGSEVLTTLNGEH
jgi:hypothetical protein